nr:F0F1 ATP synthase subunit epsilon [Schaalia cardiffensis]
MMADRVLQVEVVSHEGRLWHGAGSSVQVPVVDGQLGVLPGRQPLLAMLKAGTVTVQTSQGVKTFEVEGGFASVDSDFVTVVADHATVS